MRTRTQINVQCLWQNDNVIVAYLGARSLHRKLLDLRHFNQFFL